MNTPSHFFLQLAIKKYYGQVKKVNIPKSFILGAVAPDIILYLLVMIYIPISVYILGNDMTYTFTRMFDDLYFTHPLWIFGYNLFHSPTMLIILYIIIRYTFQDKLRKYYKILFWFLLGCGVHTLFDIPLHHDDGPRIFYPFSSYTFVSPISYWDPRYYGSYVALLELFLNISLCIYLFYIPVKNKILGKK